MAADNLKSMHAVLSEIETHAKRLVVEARGGAPNATAPLLAQELAETIMPLLHDFASLTFDEIMGMRQYLHDEVEPALLGAGGEDDSALFPDDAEMITKQLLAYRGVLEQMQLASPDDQKARVTAAIAEVDTAIARVGEITIDEDDDDDEGEGAEDDDLDDDEDDEDEEPAPVGAPTQ